MQKRHCDKIFSDQLPFEKINFVREVTKALCSQLKLNPSDIVLNCFIGKIRHF